MNEPPAAPRFPELDELSRILSHLPDQPALRMCVLDEIARFRLSLSGVAPEAEIEQTWGAEREFQIAERFDGDDGQLLRACMRNHEVVALVAPMVKEVRQDCIEANDEVTRVLAGMLTSAEATLRDFVRRLFMHTEEKGILVVPSPTSLLIEPNYGENIDAMSTGDCAPRYRQIDLSLQRLYGDRWTARIPGHEENESSSDAGAGLPWGTLPSEDLEIPVGTVAANAVMASGQLHWKTTIRNHPNASNLSRALAGPMIASAAASPLLPDKHGRVRETGCASARNAFWIGNIGRQDPRDWDEDNCVVRFGYGDWLDEEDPLSCLNAWEHDVNGVRPIVVNLCDGKSLSSPNPALALWVGTSWGLAVRDIPGWSAGSPHMRLENRMFPICCPADMMANTLMWLGGVEGMRGSDRRPASEVCTYREARQNFIAGIRDGSRATFSFHGKSVTFRKYWEETFYPAILRGAGLMGFNEGEVRKFGGILQSRLDCPPELAMRLLWRHACDSTSTHDQARTYVAHYLREKHLENVPYSIWGSEFVSKTSRHPVSV